MIDTRISYEEAYINNVYGTVTGYFMIDKSLLEELCPGKYPEAEHGEISIEYPVNRPEADMSNVMISPTKDGSDYDWRFIELPQKIVEELIETSVFRGRL